ncbi:MAG: UDP-N-acetylglucosamine 2-epimerase (non-hydrolyzing) [Rhizomicrobium sp.]|jgi:UDP-N-acetylglucosamine 2-epimerase
MTRPKRILVVAGTRPEAIKMAPVVHALRKHGDAIDLRLCSTGQHREMLAQALADFDLAADVELCVMEPGQSLASLSGKLFSAIDDLLALEQPDAVLVEGDTTTVQVAALCAFYRRIPVGHVEAGLRSHDLNLPFPEELNRRVTALAATWHFAPTELAKRNLESEHVAGDKIFVTGNTVVDALLDMRARVRAVPPALPQRIETAIAQHAPIVLITGHRRESFGQGFENICNALQRLAAKRRDVAFVYPVHLNPQVREPVHQRLADIPNILLEEPLAYRPFVRVMEACRLILTDSGGIQEEAPSLGKPVLIMRDVTERPEAIDAGVNRLVGTSTESIVDGVEELLSNDKAYQRMVSAKNPYGDGKAAERIAEILADKLRG